MLSHAHAPAHEVARHEPLVHGKRLALYDAEPAVLLQHRPVAQQLLAVGPLRQVARLLLAHRELEAELAAAQQKVGLVAAPRLDHGLGLLDEDIHGVHVLLHKAKAVNVVAQRLLQVVVEVVALAHRAQVARGVNQRHVHVEVVGVLDALHDLQDLILKVLHALLGHHKVVLHRDGETLPHGVARERLLALRERARGRFVGHARGEPLVEAPHVPLNLFVGVLHVHVREDHRRKWRLRRVYNQPVDAVREELARTEENVRDVHAPALAVAVLVLLHVVGARPKDIRPLLARGLGAVARRPGHRKGVVGVARGRFGRLRRHLQQSSSTCIAECLYMVANGWIGAMALFSGCGGGVGGGARRWRAEIGIR